MVLDFITPHHTMYLYHSIMGFTGRLYLMASHLYIIFIAVLKIFYLPFEGQKMIRVSNSNKCDKLSHLILSHTQSTANARALGH